MKGTNNKPEEEQDLLQELFLNVSSREKPSWEDEQAVREALHQQWSRMVRQRRIRRTFIVLASAASVVLAVWLGFGLMQKPQSPGAAVQLAVLEKQIGTARTHLDDTNRARPLDVQIPLGPGRHIITGRNASLGLRWQSGESVRLGENSEISLSSSQEIVLVKGQIYLDTDGANSNVDLVVSTPLGRVRHLGTQYLVAADRHVTSISVREGSVQLLSDHGDSVAGKGEQINLDIDGTVRRESIPTYGPLWQWAESLAPEFPSDGRPLAEFLDWVARESGHQLEYRSVGAEALVRETVVRGEISMEPMRALKVMLQTTDLESEVSTGTIYITMK